MTARTVMADTSATNCCVRKNRLKVRRTVTLVHMVEHDKLNLVNDSTRFDEIHECARLHVIATVFVVLGITRLEFL